MDAASYLRSLSPLAAIAPLDAVGRVHFFSIFGHDRSVFFFPAVVTPKHP